MAHLSYKPKLKFFEVGQVVAEAAFGFHFKADITKAIATARLR